MRLVVDMEKVTAVIPCTDRTAGLKRCLMSALGQDFSGDIEIILVENNSNDRSLVGGLVRDLADERIKHFYLNECDNANVARNFGAAKADGDFVAFLDSDDSWSSNHLSTCVASLSPGAAAQYSGYTLDNGFNKKIVASRGMSAGEDAYEFLFSRGGHAQTSSFFLRRYVFESCSWDESLKRNQDYDFFISVWHKYGWEYKETVTNCVVWQVGQVRTYSYDAFTRFYEKHKKLMSDSVKANYIYEVVRALSMQSRTEYYDFLSNIVGYRSYLSLYKRLHTYNYYLCLTMNRLRFLVRKFLR